MSTKEALQAALAELVALKDMKRSKGKTMTDLYHTLTVVLKEDTRDDDCKPLIDAILMLKGVASVTGRVANFDSHMAEERARLAIGEKLLAICYPRLKPGA